jgi:hypothetical protein
MTEQSSSPREISADEAASHAAHSAVQQVEGDLAEVFRRLGDNALSPKSPPPTRPARCLSRPSSA